MSEKSPKWAIVFGASGGIGAATVKRYLDNPECSDVIAVMRERSRGASVPDSASASEHQFAAERSNAALHTIAIPDHAEPLEFIEERIKATGIDLSDSYGEVVVATGVLHNQNLQPEKRLEDITLEQSLEVFESNTLLPMTYLQALARIFKRSTHASIAVLSARVGSIGDNGLGGWYSYRASKAALNMMLATLAVEFARRFPQVKLLAFHPGTTETKLSEPFRGNVSREKLFSPEFVAECLSKRLSEHEPDGHVSFVDWAGKPIPW